MGEFEEELNSDEYPRSFHVSGRYAGEVRGRLEGRIEHSRAGEQYGGGPE